MSVYNPLQLTTEEDADRLAGMVITVTLNDGSVEQSRVVDAPKVARGPFTGSGLVNAEAAIIRVRRETGRSSD